MILSDISPIQYFSIFRLEDRVVNTMVLERVTRRDLDTLYICQAANNNVSVPRSASVKIDILGETELNYWYNIETLLEVSEGYGHNLSAEAHHARLAICQYLSETKDNLYLYSIFCNHTQENSSRGMEPIIVTSGWMSCFRTRASTSAVLTIISSRPHSSCWSCR